MASISMDGNTISSGTTRIRVNYKSNTSVSQTISISGVERWDEHVRYGLCVYDDGANTVLYYSFGGTDMDEILDAVCSQYAREWEGATVTKGGVRSHDDQNMSFTINGSAQTFEVKLIEINGSSYYKTGIVSKSTIARFRKIITRLSLSAPANFSMSQGSNGTVSGSWTASSASGLSEVTVSYALYRVGSPDTKIQDTSNTSFSYAVKNAVSTLGSGSKTFYILASYGDSNGYVTSKSSNLTITINDTSVTINSFTSSQSETSRYLTITFSALGSYGTGSVTYNLYKVISGQETLIATSSPYTDTSPSYSSAVVYRLKAYFGGKTTSADRSWAAHVPEVITYPSVSISSAKGKEFTYTGTSMGSYKYASGSIVTYNFLIAKNSNDIANATNLKTINSNAIPDGAKIPTTITLSQEVSREILATFSPQNGDIFYVWIRPQISNMVSTPSAVAFVFGGASVNYCPSGGNYVECEVYYHNGSTWIPCEVLYYDGNTWHECE